jgi:hypothetical protein
MEVIVAWSEEDFFSAFDDAGMLVDAYRDGYANPVKVGFAQPTDLLLNEMVQVSKYEIEYETAVMPNLVANERLTINGTVYRVATDPEKKGNGFFSTVELIKL